MNDLPGAKPEYRLTSGVRPAPTWLCPLAVALLALLSPLDAGAQARDSSRVAAVSALTVGEHVRLDVRPVGRVEGRVILSSDTGLTLLQTAGPTHVRVMDVERLWVRGRSTGTGALIGGLVGLTAGAAYGFLIGEIACAETDCTRAEVATVVALVSGAGGALVGAGVGFMIPGWKLKFP